MISLERKEGTPSNEQDSAGVAVFVSERNYKARWVEADRAAAKPGRALGVSRTASVHAGA